MTERIESVEDLQDKLSGMRVAMLATQDERGALSSRPVTVQDLDDQGDLWFLVDHHASWVAPADGRAANASIVNEKNFWLSFSGRIRLDDNQERIDQLMGAMSDAFFDDEAEPVALCVVPHDVEWWTAPNTPKQVLELVRAKVTGDTPDTGESGTLHTGR